MDKTKDVVVRTKRVRGKRAARRRLRIPACRLERLNVFYDQGNRRWRVHPGTKTLSPGQTAIWQAFGCDSFELTLPDVFEESEPEARSRPVRRTRVLRAAARVREDAEPGVYWYRASCDHHRVHGDSDPKIIIDP